MSTYHNTLINHFVQQQDHVQPPTSALEVGMAFDEKAQYIQAVKEYNIRNHFDCKTIYFDQKRLNFMCKSYCTWILGTCNSKRHKKWIIKSIIGHHTCLEPMLKQNHWQLEKHIIA